MFEETKMSEERFMQVFLAITAFELHSGWSYKFLSFPWGISSKEEKQKIEAQRERHKNLYISIIRDKKNDFFSSPRITEEEACIVVDYIIDNLTK